jgi:glutamate-1-semialdehyde 2,1-aminomutase
MFGLFFTELDSVRCFADVNTCNMEHFKTFFHAMLDAGVYLAPSAFEAGFISSAHDADAIAATLTAAEKAFMTLKG